MLYGTENPHGGSVNKNIILDFSANTDPLGAPESVIKAAQEALKRSDRYPDPACKELVKAIASKKGVPESFILCGNGASELIYAFCAALSPLKGFVPEPAFSEYREALRAFGGSCETYMLKESEAFTPGEEMLAAIEKARPGAVFLCSPSNPAGRLTDPGLALEILSLCENIGARLFVDECFLELCDTGRSMIPSAKDRPALTVLCAFTKACGMAGLRLGYCVCSDSGLLKAMSRVTPPWNVSAAAQAAGTAALGEDAHIKKARELIRAERPLLQKALEDLGFKTIPSEANFLLFKGPEGLNAKLEKYGAAVRDCSDYPGLGAGWYRTSVRRREENEALIGALKAAAGKEDHG